MPNQIKSPPAPWLTHPMRQALRTIREGKVLVCARHYRLDGGGRTIVDVATVDAADTDCWVTTAPSVRLSTLQALERRGLIEMVSRDCARRYSGTGYHYNRCWLPTSDSRPVMQGFASCFLLIGSPTALPVSLLVILIVLFIIGFTYTAKKRSKMKPLTLADFGPEHYEQIHVTYVNKTWRVRSVFMFERRKKGAYQHGEYPTGAEADEAGHKIARKRKCELVVHYKAGGFRYRDSFGNDPPDKKG